MCKMKGGVILIDRRYIYDPPAVLSARHQPRGLLPNGESSMQVDCVDTIPFRIGYFEEWNSRKGGRTMDQNVEPAKYRGCVSDNRSSAFRSRKIAIKTRRIRSVSGYLSGKFQGSIRLTEVMDRNPGTRVCERTDHSTTNAVATRAGHQSPLSVQFHYLS
jgi:hypothetical protein